MKHKTKLQKENRRLRELLADLCRSGIRACNEYGTTDAGVPLGGRTWVHHREAIHRALSSAHLQGKRFQGLVYF